MKNYLDSKEKFKVGILLTTWNRPEFLRITFESLKNSNLKNDALVVIVDNVSQSEKTKSMIDLFEITGIKIIKIKKDKNENHMDSLSKGWGLMRGNVDYMMNIDPDVYLKKDWVDALIITHKKISEDQGNESFILTGFNFAGGAHKIKGDCKMVKEYDNQIRRNMKYCEKESVGGINLFFSSTFYSSHLSKFVEKKIKQDCWKYWDWNLVSWMNDKKFKLYATRPSVVQHLGASGYWSKPDKQFDFAEDF